MSGIIKEHLTSVFPADLEYLREFAISADEEAVKGKCSPEMRAYFLQTVAERIFENRGRMEDSWVGNIAFLTTQAFDEEIYKNASENPDLCERGVGLLINAAEEVFRNRMGAGPKAYLTDISSLTIKAFDQINDQYELQNPALCAQRAALLLNIAEHVFENRDETNKIWLQNIQALTLRAFSVLSYPRELQDPALIARKDALLARIGLDKLWPSLPCRKR